LAERRNGRSAVWFTIISERQKKACRSGVLAIEFPEGSLCMAKKKAFPRPKKPLSFQEVVDQILKDKDFANFIHDLVLKARDGNQYASDTVSEYFKPLPEELKKLKLPPDLLKHKDVNDIRCTTGHMLIDFATPAQIWRK
jgi:hypothetical protein